MNREEAVLRELNLYPLWKQRDVVTPATVQATEAIQNNPSENHTPVLPPTPPLKGNALPPLQGEGRGGDGLIEARNDTALNKGGEQTISELGWTELKTLVRDCTACKLRAGCTQTVFGVGDEKAEWLFVGEGPGADEDAQGEPFVGQAGKLLDNMLAAIRLKRGRNVYIANVVKCRPPGNRTPEADEIATCLPYLQRQIGLVQPKVIVALGKTAANALLGGDATLGSLRGRLHDFHGIPLVITYHPAYLLRTPADKAKAWQDLCLAVKTMNTNAAN